MIYTIIDKNGRIIGAVDTKRIVGFDYDGTSPEHNHRYILKLEWGHTMTVDVSDMQYILAAMRKSEVEGET